MSGYLAINPFIFQLLQLQLNYRTIKALIVINRLKEINRI